ncbi:Mitochondrial outer membrane protein porin [Golovinomyces cichoracearum]|uniref:Mitochondrial outer membrane protein porin n=1 Tax=Golovinomyces cichoracearum TaxID=62708 RepID=A0A420IY44_9PEZI|nr:Mitochondrial outer membrane protein porin [Golovinomyces cichoracearum]
MSIPSFSDIAKSSNDLLNKDFYHSSAAALEVKSNTPNNVAFKVNGKSTHEGGTSGLLEAKYSDKPTGLTLTQSWNTLNALDTKIEISDSIAKGLKAEILGSFLPATQAKGAKLNLHFQQAGFNGRAFFDLLRGPTALVDAVIGQDGFLAGASVGYNVQKASITNYSAAVGFTAPQYSASITATNNLRIFSAAYYHKVNSQVEAGSKATWDSESGSQVGLELKINDRGVAAIAYNVLLRPGVTLGLGASFDTQKLDQATHKIGTSFVFDS